MPPLTEEDRERLRRLAEDESQIDFSDIPPLNDGFFERARRVAELREERRRLAAKAAAE